MHARVFGILSIIAIDPAALRCIGCSASDSGQWFGVRFKVMVFKRLFGRDPQREAAHKAYVVLVDQARSPEFYLRHGVPDSLDGRFEMIAVHLFLILHRLKHEPDTMQFRQRLFDLMFGDMDRSLREMGTGDFGVGKQVKRMAEGFYGRIAAYDPGLAGERSRLEDGLRRNVFGTVEPDPADVAFLAAYMARQMCVLAGQDAASVMAGDIRFESVPAAPAAVEPATALSGTV